MIFCRAGLTSIPPKKTETPGVSGSSPQPLKISRAASGLERSVFSAGRRNCAAALFVVPVVFFCFAWGCLLCCWLVSVLVCGLSSSLSVGGGVLALCVLLVLRGRLVFAFCGVFGRRGLGFVAVVLVLVGAAFGSLLPVPLCRCRFSACVGLLAVLCLFAFRVPVFLRLLFGFLLLLLGELLPLLFAGAFFLRVKHEKKNCLLVTYPV